MTLAANPSSRRRAALLTVLLLGTGLGASGVVLADMYTTADGVPRLLAYEGFLSQNGTVIADGNHSMWFRLFTAESGGAAVWEYSRVVPTVDGRFSITLGESPQPAITPALFAGGDMYLEVAVGTSTDVVGRQRVLSVPYALRAAAATTSARATTADNATPSSTLEQRLETLETGDVAVAFRAHAAGPTYAIVASTTTVKAPISIIDLDTHNGFNTTTNRYTVPVAGVYSFSGSGYMVRDVGGQSLTTGNVHIYRNGVSMCHLGDFSYSAVAITIGNSCVSRVSAGDQIELFGTANTTGGAFGLGGGITELSGHRIGD